MAGHSASNEKFIQQTFWDSFMESFTADFDHFTSTLSPEESEAFHRTFEIVGSMAEDITRAVDNFAVSRTPVRDLNQDG